MPGNGRAFEALVLCQGQVKREWTTENDRKIFKAYDVDNSGVYHTLKGAGLLDDETFVSVIEIMKHYISRQVIE
jgi:hypothetical protein